MFFFPLACFPLSLFDEKNNTRVITSCSMRGSSEAAAADAEKARREARAEAAAAAEVFVDVIDEDETICCWLASRRAAAARASEPRAMLDAVVERKRGMDRRTEA